MIRPFLLALSLFGLAAPAYAQAHWAPYASEIRFESLPGPEAGTQRNAYFWRPHDAPAGPLPVLYMMDGLDGLDVAVAELRPAIMEGRARPLVVVATDAHPTLRMQEYIHWRRRTPEWERHFGWFTGTVLPWAETNAGASTERAQRGVGGVSNGADFAIAAASRRPDLFGAVLAHSPVNPPRRWFRPAAETRWVLSAGNREDMGQTALLSSRVSLALTGHPLRQCVGPWGHDLLSWRAISAGSIVWLFDLAAPETVERDVEHEHCTSRS